MSIHLTRRDVCRGLCAVVVGGLTVARIARAERLSITTAGRVFELPPDDDAKKPPVVSALRFDPTGKQLAAVGDDHHVRLYDVNEGRQTARLIGHGDWVRAVDYAFDGAKILSGGNDRKLLAWDPLDATAAPTLIATLPHAIAAVRCGRKSSLVAVAGFDKTVRLFDLAQSPAKVRELEGPGEDLRGLDFSPDDRFVAAAGREGRVRVWNTANGELVLEFQPSKRRLQALLFSPDGKHLVTAGDDRRVHVQPIVSPQMGWSLPEAGGKIFALAFLDASQVAAAGSDNKIQLWDIVEQKSLGALEGHTGSIRALDFRGRRLISAGFDTQLRVWSVGEKVAESNTVPIR